MIRTDNYIKTLSDKGLVDDAITLENGYDIQYKGNIVSVRLNDKGGALIYNQKKNNIMEIQSGRLDEVLHRYIVQSLFGIQSKKGIKDNQFDNVFFVPTKVIGNSVILEDPAGRKWSVKNSTPKAVLSYYEDARMVNADDAMILLDGFSAYSIHDREPVKSCIDNDVELTLLKSSANIDDYAVAPRSECINDIGKTVVGVFCCSSGDKVNLINFEEDSNKVFAFNSPAKRNITSGTIRTKNPYAVKGKEVLKSAAGRKAIGKYVDTKYPDGLCLSAMEQVIAYETPEILVSSKMDCNLEYKNIFQKYLKNATDVNFRMDSNKSVLCEICNSMSVAKFRMIPDLSEIRNSLKKEGYLLSELENGLSFHIEDPAIACIVSNCINFVPVSEDPLNRTNKVGKVIGSECKKTLADYGIDDQKGVFSSITQVIVN